MQFDEEMDRAAAKIQQKYRARPKNKKNQEKSKEEPPKKPSFLIIFDFLMNFF